jgi:hypothetical protein
MAESPNQELNIPRSTLVQYIADNYGHNANTLDGHGTSDGMAILGVKSPEGK